MPDVVDIEITGLKEMLDNLHSLSRKTQDTLAFRAVSRAARKVRDSAQANIQSYQLIDTGSMIGNVAFARKRPNGLIFSYDIGVRHGTRKQKKVDDDPWYWFLLEFGTVKYTGRHFMTQAFENDKEGSLDVMRDSLADGIEREVEKMKK
jgi:HK97 gp10 family phage protein